MHNALGGKNNILAIENTRKDIYKKHFVFAKALSKSAHAIFFDSVLFYINL